MIALKLVLFVLALLLIWAGATTLGGGLIFSLALNEACNEFGHGSRR